MVTIMKKVALILTWIGMGVTVLFYSVMMIIGIGRNDKESLILVIYLISIVLNSIFCFIVTKSLNEENKKTWVGVCSALLCWLVGGILYLTGLHLNPKRKKNELRIWKRPSTNHSGSTIGIKSSARYRSNHRRRIRRQTQGFTKQLSVNCSLL